MAKKGQKFNKFDMNLKKELINSNTNFLIILNHAASRTQILFQKNNELMHIWS